MDWIYLDNNATTQPTPEVVAAMAKANEQLWANPSSVHRFGQMVRQQIDLARHSVAGLIGCRDRELVFTSGGTESNNLALRSFLVDPNPASSASENRVRRVLVTTKVEHAAVREPAEFFEQHGVDLIYLPVDLAGWVDPADLAQALEKDAQPSDVVVVSIQWVNNETGVIQPIEELAKVIEQMRSSWRDDETQAHRKTRLVFHVDATQAVGKLIVDLGAIPIDLMTFSAHKFHGPKGVGGLYVRRGVKVRPLILGGPQESERRGGTEHAAGIIGMGVAAQQACEFIDDQAGVERIEKLRDRFEAKVVEALPDAVVNSSSRPRVWNTANIGFPQLEAEAILLGLSERRVCASAGAACSSGSLEPSPVLLAMGIGEPIAHGSLRFSLSRFTTEQEVDEAIEVLVEVVQRVGRTLPMG